MGSDLRYAFRLFRQSPLTTAAVLLILGLGIGGTTGIFSVVNNTLFKPMLLPSIERMVRIDDITVGPGGLGNESNVSPRTASMLLAQQSVFSAVALQDARWFALTGSGDPERLRGAGISLDWVGTLGVPPVLGRAFTAQEHKEGNGSAVALVSYDLWQRRFAGSSNVLGASITLNGRTRTIVGVMPRGFHFPYEAEVWTPIEFDSSEQAHYLLAFGRLRPGATLGEVQAQLQTISRRVTAAFGKGEQEWQLRATPLRENLVRGYDRTALALLAAVGFLLLIACVNVSSLLLARSTLRRQELVLRAALGAARARLIRQLLTEGLLLSLLGGLLGLAIALLVRPFLAHLVPPVMSVELAQDQIALDARVFAFTLLLSAGAGLGAAILPALRAAPADLQSALREGSRTGRARGSNTAVRTIVIAEIALATMLLFGAGAVVHTFRSNYGDSEGFDPAGVLTMRLSLSDASYPTLAARLNAADAIAADLATQPGVQSVALSTTNPRLSSWSADVNPAGSTAAPTSAQFVAVSPEFFRAMRLPVREGRSFTNTDRSGGARVALVSRSLARRLWPGQSALSKQLQLDPNAPALTVVGVAEDAQYADEPFRNAVYIPISQLASPVVAREFHVMVRTSGDPPMLARPLQQAIWKHDRNLPIFGVAPLADVQSSEFVLERTGAALGTAFATFGALLSVFGILGILSYTVTQARFDWGVRLALGAAPLDVLNTLMLRGLVLVGTGAVIGVLGGTLLTGVLRQLLSGIQPLSAQQMVVLPATLVVLGAAACFIPARRASRIAPLILLRE